MTNFHMKKLVLTIFICLFTIPTSLQAWDRLQRGLAHQIVNYGGGAVHLYRIDLNKFSLKLLDARQYGMTALSTRDFAKRSQALMVVNGGFFGENYSPLGLMIQKGKELNSLRKVEWGVFYIDNNLPKIVHTREFTPSPTITTALQTGPRLVIGGTIPSLVPGGKARRSAIGIASNNEIVIAVTQDALVTMKEWADLMRRHCPYALNLDGGGSSQLYFKIPGQEVQITGITPVPNALGIFRK